MSNNPLIYQIIKKCVHAYSVVGKRPSNFLLNFDFYRVPDWLDPESSPLFLKPGETFNISDLDYIEEYFKQETFGPFDKKIAYFSIFQLSNNNDNDLWHKLLLERQWQKERIDTVNIWNQLSPMELPKDYTYITKPNNDEQIKPIFRRLIKQNFKVNDGYIDLMNKSAMSVEDKIFTTVIFDVKMEPVGLGSFYVDPHTLCSYLFCGNIVSDHRGRGLWRSLVGIRQQESLKQNSDLWFLTTQNANIKGKCDFSVDFVTYSKAIC